MSDSNSLYDRFFVMNEEDTVQEIRTSLREMYQDQFPYQELSLIEADIFDLFRGDFPGYRHSTTSYHDLPHTLSVYLATARLFHGAFLAGKIISAKATFNGIIAALMHDVGLIQTEDDTEGTGAKYTQGHEQRSIDFASTYFSQPNRSFPEINMDMIAKAIYCTILSQDPRTVKFKSDEEKIVCYSVGAADLYAQMADRGYLEKLLRLYDEFTEANIPGYDSPFDLLKKTQGFWDFVVKARIQDNMDNIGDYFAPHFNKTIQQNSNLYLESIQKNLSYLNEVVQERESNYQEMLRRTSELISRD